MLELLFCSLLTIVPDYLYRRYAQGKRLGKEITFYSVWFELRWGITSCLILTVGLITVIFYNHPSTQQRHSVLQNRPNRSGDQWSRFRGLRWRKRPCQQRGADSSGWTAPSRKPQRRVRAEKLRRLTQRFRWRNPTY